jgi:hypothetical protein
MTLGQGPFPSFSPVEVVQVRAGSELLPARRWMRLLYANDVRRRAAR